MTPSSNATALAKRFEGCKLLAYPDSGGVWTVGYGHTGHEVVEGLLITQEDAERLLEQNLTNAGNWVDRLVSVDINQNQFDALCDFVFNLGAQNLATSSLLRYINAGDFESANNEFPKWNHCRGQVLAGLTARRAAEQELFNG